MCTMLTNRAPPVSDAAGPTPPVSDAAGPTPPPRPRRRHAKGGGHAVRHLGAVRLSLPPRCTLAALCVASLIWVLLLYFYVGLEEGIGGSGGGQGAWPREPGVVAPDEPAAGGESGVREEGAKSEERWTREGGAKEVEISARETGVHEGSLARGENEERRVVLGQEDEASHDGIAADDESLEHDDPPREGTVGHDARDKDAVYHTETVVDADSIIDSVPLSKGALALLGRVRTAGDRRNRQQGYNQHAFNTLISERLGLIRALPDTRHEGCGNHTYPSHLPSVSVVVCFYNEHAATLLRSVTTVLRRSPDHLLRELILVDDASDLPNLTEAVTEHIAKHGLRDKVRLLRSEERLGLIRARLHGAAHASGKVLVFLDSHIEVNADWLPPLLAPISADPHTVTVPVVDVINADTFAYTGSPLVRGGFKWDMHFTWVSLSDSQKLAGDFFYTPFDTPAMSGGLFAMDRDYFYQLGGYDEGMDIWGGENLELSFRVWTCGGRLQIVPCSRIGHVFRKRRPYDNPAGTKSILQNLLRLVLVWLDEYREHFFDAFPEAAGLEYGDISSRLALRRRLACRPFSWYVSEVYPELEVPETRGRQLGGVNAGGRGGTETGPLTLRRAGTEVCVQPESDAAGAGLVMQSCNSQAEQVFWETVRQELRWTASATSSDQQDSGLCVTAGEYAPVLSQCHLQNGDQQWNYPTRVGSPVFNLVAGKCLAAAGREGAPVTLEMCSEDATFTWDILTTHKIDHDDA